MPRYTLRIKSILIIEISNSSLGMFFFFLLFGLTLPDLLTIIILMHKVAGKELACVWKVTALLCWSPRADATKHRRGGLTQHEFLFSQSWRPDVWKCFHWAGIKVLARAAPHLEACSGGQVLSLPLLASAGCRQYLVPDHKLSAFMMTLASLLSVSSFPLAPFYLDPWDCIQGPPW